MEIETRKAEMLRMRTENAMTLQQIGDVFGITRERVRQIIGDSKNYTQDRFEKTLNNDRWMQQHRDLTDREIARLLGVPERTVKARRANRIRPPSGEINSHSAVGAYSEWLVARKLESLGFDVRDPLTSDFDMYVNDHRVDVKSSVPAEGDNIITEKLVSPYYKFNLGNKRKRMKTDFFILHMRDVGKFFVIPVKETLKRKCSIIAFVHPHNGSGPKSKWWEYEDRWDLLANDLLQERNNGMKELLTR